MPMRETDRVYDELLVTLVKAGDRVRHAQFGEGVVVNCQKYSGIFQKH